MCDTVVIARERKDNLPNVFEMQNNSRIALYFSPRLRSTTCVLAPQASLASHLWSPNYELSSTLSDMLGRGPSIKSACNFGATEMMETGD